MGNSGSAFNRWDQLFQALTRPEDLRAYLEQMAPLEQGPRQGALRTQIELLTGTLQLEIALLRVSEVAESFDTATFCLGQLVSHEPQMISELPFAHTFVDGLSSALRKGWLVHHGVGKFAANALTILCICEQAVPAVREHAIAELLSGLLEWLRSDDPAADVDEVCGCNCGCPALSATCWLERLLSKPDELLEARVRESPQLWPLVTAMLHVICRRDGNPFALTRLLRIPSVFGDLMRHDEAAASTTLNFLTFGMLQFDNPMFTEDAVQRLDSARDSARAAATDSTADVAKDRAATGADTLIAPDDLPGMQALTTARVLHQIRAQYDAGVGLGGDLSATLEVNFKDENSAGSAVRREWFALVSEAFVAPSAGLLIGTERGASVRPLPMLATDPRLPQQLRDLEMLGRFLGLAIIQQVCVGVRLHPSLCRSLLAHGQRWEWTYEDVEQLDAQLYQHKVNSCLVVRHSR
ncbi:hypothetical protein Ctob_008174 [Chrysochromulina tobinii]|uniref:HECT domain-containing protein n=1 Tax=Chrysochromulina tobinii TaxID=1460289 RepID=A0A0M0K3P4_9EUKA|nr:hypothetical protein Ctob_008174 [Chrysochromulina tobinii]|eukprot:KOO33434.1 hypothetical protein Ctob_008174 [Chrysochromulina sp. CCMP291]